MDGRFVVLSIVVVLFNAAILAGTGVFLWKLVAMATGH